jgi:hypothetical protein
LWTTPTNGFPPPNHRSPLPPLRCRVARGRLHSQAPYSCHCSPDVCGEADEARTLRWRRRKEARALRAEGVWMGVWGEVECCSQEAVVGRKGVM